MMRMDGCIRIGFVNNLFLILSRDEFVYSWAVGFRMLLVLLKRQNHDFAFIDALRRGVHNVTPYAYGYRVGLT